MKTEGGTQQRILTVLCIRYVSPMKSTWANQDRPFDWRSGWGLRRKRLTTIRMTISRFGARERTPKERGYDGSTTLSHIDKQWHPSKQGKALSEAHTPFLSSLWSSSGAWQRMGMGFSQPNDQPTLNCILYDWPGYEDAHLLDMLLCQAASIQYWYLV